MIPINRDDVSYFMQRADMIAISSRDPSTKVGAVLVCRNGTQTQSCNHFVGLDMDPAASTREERYATVIHAELGAVLAAGSGNARNAVLFVTQEPCGECWKLIRAVGIKTVVCRRPDDERRARWGCDGIHRQGFLGDGNVLLYVE